MKVVFRIALSLALALAAALAGVAASADAATTSATNATNTSATPPQFADGFGLTVVGQPAWVDANHRTFTLAVTSDQVPNPTLLPGQLPHQLVLMVTLPEDYDATAATDTRYPVLYVLHGNQDEPNALWNQQITENATAGVPLITVYPDGGRSWYTNWANPGGLGPQNWETFALDQVIPLIDANLRTIPTRAGRAIAGHSMGGFGAFHYAEDRPDLFSYVGSFSGGLDLDNPAERAAVVETELDPNSGTPTVSADSIFGSPIWPFDGAWVAQSPAEHVSALRGMGVAIYTGNGGDLTVDPVEAVIEYEAEQTALLTDANLKAAGITDHFVDYGDGSDWAAGCTGKHAQQPCVQADMNDFVSLIMQHLQHP